MEATGIEHCNCLRTPTKIEETLGKDANVSEANRDWPNSYTYFIGMMLYLASNTIPDISFAVHQCDHFTHNIKELQETDVERICRYLKGTKDNGLVFNPSNKLVVDFYDDAYFAGLWGHEKPEDPIFTRSRTGFVVNFPTVLYCGCQNYRHSLLFLH